MGYSDKNQDMYYDERMCALTPTWWVYLELEPQKAISTISKTILLLCIVFSFKIKLRFECSKYHVFMFCYEILGIRFNNFVKEQDL